LYIAPLVAIVHLFLHFFPSTISSLTNVAAGLLPLWILHANTCIQGCTKKRIKIIVRGKNPINVYIVWSWTTRLLRFQESSVVFVVVFFVYSAVHPYHPSPSFTTKLEKLAVVFIILLTIPRHIRQLAEPVESITQFLQATHKIF
jgi:hypothetical protein